MADQDQAQQDDGGGGSVWDSVANAASSAWNGVKKVASNPEVQDAGQDFAEDKAVELMKGIPAAGSLPSIVHGAQDADKASDARLDAMKNPDDKDRVNFDNEKDAYYGGKEESDAIGAVAGAIPLIGALYAGAEEVSGIYNYATGGEGGFKGGKDNFDNHVADVADMATTNWKGITGGSSDTHVADAGWGARAALQQKYQQDAAQRGAEP